MWIVGHRGARNEAPENTLEAFEHAFLNGCRHFELDIQLSSDLVPMVIHDTTLKRTTGVRGRVNAFSAHALSAMDARRNTPGWPHPCAIPTLSEVTLRFPDVLHWQFEVKTDSRFRLAVVAQKLVQFIQTHHLQQRVTITSSDRWLLREVHRIAPAQSTGLVAESRFYDPVRMANNLGCDYLCLSRKLVTQKRVRLAKQRGMTVSVWTVNDLFEMASLQEMGIDSVITDVPTLALHRFR